MSRCVPMSYRPPPRTRSNSAISKRRQQRRQQHAQLVAVGLLLGLGALLLVGLVFGIRSCSAARKLAQDSPARRTAQNGTNGGAARSTEPPARPEAKKGADAAAKPADAEASKPATPKAGVPKLAQKRRFKPAPFALIHDGKTLYTAQEQPGFSLFGAPPRRYPDLFALDSLSAFPLAGGRRSWEAALEANFSEMGLAAGNVVLFNPYEAYAPSAEQRRASADNPDSLQNQGLMLAAYNCQDGSLAWSQSIAGALDGSVGMDSKAVVVAYRAPGAVAGSSTAADGSGGVLRQAAEWRLAAYNAATGAKAWSGAPNLKTLQADQVEQSGAELSLALRNWEGLTVYTCHNVAGLIQSGSGNSIATYTAPGYIYATAYDLSVKTLYMLNASLQPGRYDLNAVNIGGKSKARDKPLGSFESSSERFLLLAESGFAAVAMQTGVAAGQRQQAEERAGQVQLATKLVCFQNGRQEAILSHQFASGEAVDIAAIPGAPGEFLIALSSEIDANGLPRGNGSLYRARCQDGSVWEVSGRKEPAVWLMPYRNAVLLLYKGGQIQRFIPESNKCVDLVRGAYQHVEPAPGRSRSTAVISSYPQGYLEGKGGQQMQVLVFE